MYIPHFAYLFMDKNYFHFSLTVAHAAMSIGM